MSKLLKSKNQTHTFQLHHKIFILYKLPSDDLFNTARSCLDVGISYPMIICSAWEFSCVIRSNEFGFFSLKTKKSRHPWFGRIAYFSYDVIYLIGKITWRLNVVFHSRHLTIFFIYQILLASWVNQEDVISTHPSRTLVFIYSIIVIGRLNEGNNYLLSGTTPNMTKYN